MRIRIKELEITFPKNAYFFNCVAVSEGQILINIEGNCTFPEIEVRNFSREKIVKSKNIDMQKVENFRTLKLFNSHAIGMTVARPKGFEIDFVRNPTSGSAA